ncbi:MAG: diguanylate cyclase [Chloroflexaceae bacterium]|nr:diguanylate cyclase [Chloroflexaceae bacterium]
MKVLIVDDDFIARYTLETRLLFNGYEVITAANGQIAWSILQDELIQLVITDWMMPELDGIGLVQRIRRAHFSRYIYIILLTSRSGQDDLITGLQAGSDDYLKKPFHEGELLARLAIGERILKLESELREAHDQLYLRATHDGLTGLLNRQAIVERANMELERSLRNGLPVSIAMLDVDHFKLVNDTYGHIVGDTVLVHITQMVMRSVRGYDGVGRWGGEEIMLVMPETSLEQARVIAERIREQIASMTIPLETGALVSVTVSMGISSTEDLHTSQLRSNLDTLVRQADEALYRAKHSGRNRVALYTPLSVRPSS